jgi:acetyl esterase/lipase
MRRRTLLGLPALLGLGAASCSSPEPPRHDGSVQTIRYGDDPSQFVELSTPAGTSRGVVVVIHGGFWRAAYDLSLGRPLAASLSAAGFTALNIEYRRVGNGGGVPATLDDVRAAIGTLPAPTGPVVALGHSAGGHLAAWAAASVPGVTHVVSQAGVLDLVAARRDRLGNGAVDDFLGDAPLDASVDPTQQLPLAVPLWCVHGTDDTNVPYSQSTTYVERATAAGAEAHLITIEGGDHFVLIDPDSDAWARTLEVLEGISPGG